MRATVGETAQPKHWHVVVAWVLLWTLVSLLTLPLMSTGGQLSVFFRGGLSLALLVWLGLRYVPLVFVTWWVTLPLLSQFPATSTFVTLERAGVVASSYAVGCVALRLAGVDWRLARLRDVILFLGLGAFLTAAVQGLLLRAIGLTVLDRMLPSLVSMVSVTPFLLVNVVPWIEGLYAKAPRRGRRESLHLLDIGMASACICAMVGVANYVDQHWNLNLYFACFFPLVWVAYRHGLAMTTSVVFTSAMGVALLQALAWPDAAINNSRAAVVFCSVAGLLLGAFVEERWRSEEVVRKLAVMRLEGTGLAFFESLAKNLAEVLEADYVLAGELIAPERKKVRTLAVWADGKRSGDVEYDLAGTPCEEVARSAEVCSFAAGVQERFPSDQMLVDLGIESYAGVPLSSKSGQILGLLVVLSRERMRNPQWVEAGVAAFAARAAAEIERMEHEEALERSEQRYKAFVQNSQESVWRIEFEPPVPVHLPREELAEQIVASGYVADINDFGAKLRGFDTGEELRGMPLETLLEYEGIGMDTIRMVIDNGYKLSRGVFPMAGRDGQRLWVARTGFGVVENGCLQRVWGNAQDVTELVEAREQIRMLNADLEASVARRTYELRAVIRELEAFSYSVSHDLRAPLLGILGSARALSEDFGGELPPSGKEWVGRIQQDATHLDTLLDSMLALSRVTQSEVFWQAVDLSAIAEGVLSHLRRREPSHPAAVYVAPGLQAMGDPALLRVVMENLIGNAWKFSRMHPQARIEIGCDEEEGKLVYYVRDNGAGFDPHYADRLFGAFQRLHGNEFEGTGIGLATVQRVVHRHGGEVWAEGQVGKGATISFTLGQAV